MSCAAIIVAAGSGSRMNIGGNKLLCEICGKTVIERTLETFESAECIDALILVVSDKKEFLPYTEKFSKVKMIVQGGKTRCESVKNGLLYTNKYELVAVHDGDRPFVSQQIISEAVLTAEKMGAAVPCIPVTDTIKFTENGIIKETPERSALRAAQTPQVFKRELLMKAYSGDMTGATDDSSLVEKFHPVAVVRGSDENIKLTLRGDLQTAENIVRRQRGETL